jgi:hypothetical protein
MSAWRWQTAKAMARKYPSAVAGACRRVESGRSTDGPTSCRSTAGPLRVGRAGRCSKTLSCGERGGRCLIVSGCAVFDPEVTAYDVRLPESRRYGEGQRAHEW